MMSFWLCTGIVPTMIDNCAQIIVIRYGATTKNDACGRGLYGPLNQWQYVQPSWMQRITTVRQSFGKRLSSKGISTHEPR